MKTSNPLNDFFDKIFIISIKRNKDRLTKLKETLSGYNYEIFEGVDGTELFPDIENVADFPDVFFVDNQLDPKRCKLWNKGQLGCALSNRNVHKEIIRRGINKALILEDDALLIEANITTFIKSLNELPTNWELFYLGYNNICKYSNIRIIRPLLDLRYKIKPVSPEGLNSSKSGFLPKTFTNNLDVPGVFYGTHAYALSLDGAKILLQFDTPLKYGFDTLLMNLCYNSQVKAFALHKPLFIPNSTFKTSLINRLVNID